MHKLRKISLTLVVVASIGVFNVALMASDLILADQGTTVAKLDESKLLEKARAYSEKKSWKCSIPKLGRIIFFMDRLKTNCTAVELMMETTVYANGKPVVDRYSTILWFDAKGDVFENAEPVGFENSVVPGNPMDSVLTDVKASPSRPYQSK